MITVSSRACCTLVVGLAILMPSGVAGPVEAGHALVDAAGQQREAGQRPSLSLRAAPPVGTSPLRVRASIEIRGGSDDHQDFYCPAIEWEWGDGTSSESFADCAPYEAGKSTIERRYSAEHVYRGAGAYRLVFRIKQRNRQVAAANTTVTVRGGLDDDFGR